MTTILAKPTKWTDHITCSPDLPVKTTSMKSQSLFLRMKSLLFGIVLLITCPFLCGSSGFTRDNRVQYDAGKSAFELMDTQSKVPSYGVCWKNAMVMIQGGCKYLTDDVQNRLALAYLNCFLDSQGRPLYECDQTQSIQDCTKDMTDADRGSMVTFFTHTQNICYFLESQTWHEETEKTIHNLAHSSQTVASQLEMTTELQKDLLKKQNQTLLNQKEMLSQADNLSQIISSSTENLHSMFSEFRKTTAEQRDVINNIFDKLTKLQTLVIGEFSGFYSAVYYVIAIVVSYLLTSTPRTSSARLIMFGIITVNMILERCIIYWRTSNVLGDLTLDQEVLYQDHWMCRKVSGTLAFLSCVICAYRYEDLNKINNQLLLDIKKQNSELKSLLHNGAGNRIPVNKDYVDSAVSQHAILATADSTGYESDSAVSSYSGYSSRSSSSYDSVDTSYVPPSEDRSRTASTYTNVSLTDELESLRSSTPMTELQRRVAAWSSTGFYRHSTPDINLMEGSNSADQMTSPLASIEARSTTKYNLRPRKKNMEANPIVRSESPGRFYKVVKISEKATRSRTKNTTQNDTTESEIHS